MVTLLPPYWDGITERGRGLSVIMHGHGPLKIVTILKIKDHFSNVDKSKRAVADKKGHTLYTDFIVEFF